MHHGGSNFSGPSECVLFVVFGVVTVLLFSFLLCGYYFSSELCQINFSLKIFFLYLPPLSDGRTIACAPRAKTAGWSVRLLNVLQIPIE